MLIHILELHKFEAYPVMCLKLTYFYYIIFFYVKLTNVFSDICHLRIINPSGKNLVGRLCITHFISITGSEVTPLADTLIT